MTQSNQYEDKELRALLEEFVLYTDNTPFSNEPTELSVFLRGCDFPDAIERLGKELKQLITQKQLEAEKRGVAWTIKQIDDVHFNTPLSQYDTDKMFKGMKNTLRDRFKAETGIDPAPSYPINVELTKQEGKGNV